MIMKYIFIWMPKDERVRVWARLVPSQAGRVVTSYDYGSPLLLWERFGLWKGGGGDTNLAFIGFHDNGGMWSCGHYIRGDEH